MTDSDPQTNMPPRSVASLKIELRKANDLLQSIRFAYEGGPAATKQELILLILFGKILVDYHGHGTEAWISKPIDRKDFFVRAVDNYKPLFQSKLGLETGGQIVVTNCIIELVFSCFEEKANYICKDGRNFERAEGHQVGYEAYKSALQTERAREVLEKFRAGKLSSKSSPLWWPTHLRVRPLLGTRECRLALMHARLSKWIKAKCGDSPLINFYLDIASTAPSPLGLIEKRCPNLTQFQLQLNAHYERLSNCGDSVFVELSEDGVLRVVAKQPGTADERTSSPKDVPDQNLAGTKNVAKRDLQTTLGKLDDEEIGGRLEVADLLLQWLKGGRKPKMSSPAFMDWLKGKGYEGDYDGFKRAYAWDRKMRSEHSFAAKGPNRPPLTEMIRSQEKWIAALKLVQGARL
ncbi:MULTISPECIES: hypothetical protein [Rhodopirellula]|uniref:hypothetical protein n=1 Tax=Rhodopirellula TaxID=265488 RepID=UPI001F379280|nr:MULTISPECIES: hypothetical protein [Rhodopirellula]MCR9209375.1 hypothetical protein [bacterium]